MTRPVKVLTLALWIVAVAGMVVVMAMQLSTRDRQGTPADGQLLSSVPPEAVLGQDHPIEVPAFALTDQLNRTVTSEDLKGHPWIADFIFTECASACPLMSKHLADLQTQIPPEVKFISFSVDPEHDTPEAFRAYALKYGADNQRWRFLTGEKNTELATVAGMKVVYLPATKDNPIEHDIHFLLMDSQNRLHGVYDSRAQDEIDRLVKDAIALAGEDKPTTQQAPQITSKGIAQ